MTGKGPESRVHGSPPWCSPSPIQPVTQMQAFRALNLFTLFQPSSVSIWARQICSPARTRACKIHVAPQRLHKPRSLLYTAQNASCLVLNCSRSAFQKSLWWLSPVHPVSSSYMCQFSTWTDVRIPTEGTNPVITSGSPPPPRPPGVYIMQCE